MFSYPYGVAVDGAGTVYVADTVNNRIRTLTPSGVSSTLAGNGTSGFVNGSGGANGTAEFMQPYGVTVDKLGVVYVADSNNQTVRKITISH
jgi:streptogramin lyase